MHRIQSVVVNHPSVSTATQIQWLFVCVSISKIEFDSEWDLFIHSFIHLVASVFFGGIADSLSHDIKNEAVIEIEDDDKNDKEDGGNQAAGAQIENAVEKDANGKANGNDGKRQRSVEAEVNLGELVIPLDKSDQTNKTPRAKSSGRPIGAKTAKRTTQNTRKSPRF